MPLPSATTSSRWRLIRSDNIRAAPSVSRRGSTGYITASASKAPCSSTATTLAAGAEAGVEGKHAPPTQRRRQKQLPEIVGEYAYGHGIGLFFQGGGRFIFHRGLYQALISVCHSRVDKLTARARSVFRPNAPQSEPTSRGSSEIVYFNLRKPSASARRKARYWCERQRRSSRLKPAYSA